MEKKKKAQLNTVWLGDRGSVRWGHSWCHTGAWGHGGGGFAVRITSSEQSLGSLVGKCCCGVQCHSPACKDIVPV